MAATGSYPANAVRVDASGVDQGDVDASQLVHGYSVQTEWTVRGCLVQRCQADHDWGGIFYLTPRNGYPCATVTVDVIAGIPAAVATLVLCGTGVKVGSGIRPVSMRVRTGVAFCCRFPGEHRSGPVQFFIRYDALPAVDKCKHGAVVALMEPPPVVRDVGSWKSDKSFSVLMPQAVETFYVPVVRNAVNAIRLQSLTLVSYDIGPLTLSTKSIVLRVPGTGTDKICITYHSHAEKVPDFVRYKVCLYSELY